MMRAFLALLVISSCASAAIRVDINPDNGRKDAMAPDCDNWQVKDGPEATQKFGDVTATLRGGIAGVIWKAGYDTGAVITSDGVAGPKLEIVIAGLAPGRHSLVTWHNWIDKSTPNTIDITVDGKPAVKDVKYSVRAAHDTDAASSYIEFDAVAGKDVVIGFIGNTILNGFEIDTADPTKRAIKPTPANLDEHASEEPELTWTAPKSAAGYQLYLGSSIASVEAATPASPEFKGNLESPKFQTKSLNTFDTYFWRVDTVAADKSVARGDVWSFRVRHLAFPGAEGYGRFARGGRGGRVFEVTTLDDYISDPAHPERNEPLIPGSLREAVEATGPRTVVFRVGGTIRLKDKLVIRNPCITVAGQTAPGDGICIGGYTFGNYGTHDSIIRYVRIRVSDESGKTMDGTGFASTDHSIMDHCSVSWSIDEAVSSRGAKNITFQRGLVAQALNVAGHAKYGQGKGHSFAGSISGNIGSFHHNLLAHCAGRNWSLAGGLTQGGKFAGYLDIRNNVVFNWEHRTNDGGVRMLNLVNNYYIPGPASRVFHLLIAEMEMKVPGDLQQYFVSGNRMEGKPQYDANNWLNGGVKDPRGDASRMKLSEPFCEPFVATQSAKEAYDNVIADVGANWPRLDSHDQQVLDDVIQRKATFKGSKTGIPGIIDSQKDCGGWPELKSGEAPADTDHDGMPDEWEKTHNLNPNDAADGNGDSVGDGYTNLERYLNSIVAKKAG